jgi:hypothetical protein
MLVDGKTLAAQTGGSLPGRTPLAAAKRDCEAGQHTGTERGHLIGFIVALQARGSE